MTKTMILRIFFLTGFVLLLSACMGEPELPSLEAAPLPTIVPPAVNPTVAAYPRISIRFEAALLAADQQVPQIPHDMIGRSDCLMCHKQGISQAPRVPDSHRGLDNETCQTCHTAFVSAELSGEEMYTRICARCHGEQGEGGFAPALNNKTFLESTTDSQLREAIIRGRGAPQMLAWGDLGLLTERQVDEMVIMLRAWETDAPAEVASPADEPASAARGEAASGEVLFAQYCSGCHGFQGEVDVGDGSVLAEVIKDRDDEALSAIIRDGDQAMPSFHAILTSEDISDLLAFLRGLSGSTGAEPVEASFSGNVLPLFEEKCGMCHGTSGGWDASDYTQVMASGDHAPNIIPGDADASPLVQRLRGTQETGGIMPPGTPLSDEEIDLIVRWIEAGAADD